MWIKGLRRIGGLVAVLFCAVLGDAAAASRNDPPLNNLPIPCEAIDSVGTAKMSADGTITLRIRSLWPQPPAETTLVYAPGDAQYVLIQRHLGGIEPGQSKPVPPLCGTNSEP
jgi:hypothetical protein